jgi:hypothetical protein
MSADRLIVRVGIIINGGLSMDVDADDGCQGAGFTLLVVARDRHRRRLGNSR